MFVIKNSYLASIVFPSAPGNGQKLFFNDIPVLRGKKITGMEVYTAGDIAVNPNGSTVIADADADQIVITLTDIQSREFIYQAPILNYNPRNQNGLIRGICPSKVDLQRSYITVCDNTGISANEAICINFYYEL
jgi:hypothetical protein